MCQNTNLNLRGATPNTSDDLQLSWALVNTAVSQESLNRSVGNLWKFATQPNHVGQFLTAGCMAQKRLTFNVQLTLNEVVRAAFSLFKLTHLMIKS